MQFAHPNILYALFLLVIPIIIHLFQLRKYAPVAFTNVAMLQRIEKQRRKSHTILQWLLLLLRLLMYASIIFAFSQPFLAKESLTEQREETLLYIDNSMSLDANLGNSSLLHNIKSEIQKLEELPSQISWFTNTDVYYDQSPKQFVETIRKLSLSPITRSANEIKLLAQQLANRHPEKKYRLLWISDFHRFKENDLDDLEKIAIEAYAIQPDNLYNTYIDTLYTNADNQKLIAEIYHRGKESETTVSLYNEDKVIGRQKIALKDSVIEKVEFAIDFEEIPIGKLEIEDSYIPFDNKKYFSLMPNEPIKIKAIGNGKVDYLKIFDSPEFNLDIISENGNDYSGIEQANFIIIYNIDRLTPQLSSVLENSIEQGAQILFIPSDNIHIDSYNNLLQRLDAPQYTNKNNHKRRLSTIHYDHPVFKGVFERRVDNFQNPYINQFYKLQNNGTPILSYDSGDAFITQSGGIYVLSASLNEENTNFIKSPLIVPTLYNIALQSRPQKQLYQLLGQPSTYTITGDFNSQDILHITDNENSFIPIQEQKQNAVWITTTDRPLESGNFRITKENETLDWVSYNYPNLSKDISYPTLENWQTVLHTKTLSIPDTTQSLDTESHTLWKWFVIFALLFLGIEILLLKIYR